MIDESTRTRLYREAFALLARAQSLLLAARAKHEQKAGELPKAA